MKLPDLSDPGFQAFIRQELNLTERAEFTSCRVFEGTPFQERCIGIVQEQGITSILLSGEYEISGDAVIFSLGLPGAPDTRVPRKEIIAAGFRPEKTRLIGVCIRKEGTGTPADAPDLWVIIIPY